MTVNVSALKVWRKKQRELNRLRVEHHETELVKEHLKTAMKAIGVPGAKWKLDVMDLSYEQQVSLLERYADKLTEEIEVFKERWHSAGRNGARWLEGERSSVLTSLARVKISQLKAEHTPGRRT